MSVLTQVIVYTVCVMMLIGLIVYLATPAKSTSQRTLVFFFKTGCPWCDVMKPAWGALTSKNGVIYISVDMTGELNRKQYEYLNIKSYPTIIGFQDDRRVEYSGDRSTESLRKFGETF